MALAYLLDPFIQHQNLAGVNNVNGYFEVFYDQTDDHATVYTDFNGTLAPEHIVIDNSGRCVMVADSSRVYRVEMREPNGALVYSQYPVWTQNSGGGSGSATSIVSSDGSIDVDKTQIGSTSQYDLSVAEDSAEYLEWARCSTTRNPTSNVFYPIGDENSTIFSDNTGLVLSANGLYHVSLKVVATKSAVVPFYDKIALNVKTDDGTETTTQLSYGAVVDGSMGLEQEYEVSGDIRTGDAETTRIFVTVEDTSVSGLTYSLASFDIHRVYSGVPRIPGGIQGKLTAGSGITITPDNIISATGGGGSVSYRVLTAAPDAEEIAQIVRDAAQLTEQGSALVIGIYNSYDGSLTWYNQTIFKLSSATTGLVGFTCCSPDFVGGGWSHGYYSAVFYAGADPTQNYSRFMAGFGNNIHVWDPWMNFGG